MKRKRLTDPAAFVFHLSRAFTTPPQAAPDRLRISLVTRVPQRSSAPLPLCVDPYPSRIPRAPL
jgi:hypothetical protein